MITVEQAIEILHAVNAYGDTERIFGIREQQKKPQDEIDQASLRADAALTEVTTLLRPHLDEPDHEALRGRFAAPAPDESKGDEREEWFEPSTPWSER